MRRFTAAALLLASLAVAACGSSAAKSTGPSCPGSRSLPQSYADSGPITTTFHFVQTGCSIAIASMELRAGKQVVRQVVFHPALPAGALNAEMDAKWSGSGSFRATANRAGPLGAISITDEGKYEATANVVFVAPFGGSTKQWAADATASSQLSDRWAATQATGAPADKAWVPGAKDGGSEWLELHYDQAVVPTGIDIWEFNGPGFVTKVEGYDQKKGTWVKLWEGVDPTAHAPAAFAPPLAKTSLSTNRIRVTVNTAVADWNEIGAVDLIGAGQPAGRVIWLQGSWVETGKRTSCLDKKCTTASMNGAIRDWSLAINSLTGKLGATPEQVSS